MLGTQQCTVVDVGRSALGIFHNVMGMTPHRWCMAPIDPSATAVANCECPALRGTEVSLGRPQPQRLTVVAEEKSSNARVARELGNGLRRYGFADIVEPPDTATFPQIVERDDCHNRRETAKATRCRIGHASASGNQPNEDVEVALLASAWVVQRFGWVTLLIAKESWMYPGVCTLGKCRTQECRGPRVGEPTERSHSIDLRTKGKTSVEAQFFVPGWCTIRVGQLAPRACVRTQVVARQSECGGAERCLRGVELLGCGYRVGRLLERAHNVRRGIHSYVPVAQGDRELRAQWRFGRAVWRDVRGDRCAEADATCGIPLGRAGEVLEEVNSSPVTEAIGESGGAEFEPGTMLDLRREEESHRVNGAAVLLGKRGCCTQVCVAELREIEVGKTSGRDIQCRFQFVKFAHKDTVSGRALMVGSRF